MASLLELQAGRVSRFLQKWSGIKGTVRETLGSEIQPSVHIPTGVEVRFLDSWNIFAVSSNIAAGGAGTFASTRLRNPVSSGVIAVVEMATVSGAALDDPSFQQGVILTDLTTPISTTNNRLDARSGPTAGATCIISVGVPTTALAAVHLSKFFPANSSVDFILDSNQEFPLLPGDALQLQAGTANQAQTQAIRWRERALEDSEKF